MNHIDVKAYSIGEMGEADKRSAAAHVASCEACREDLAGLQATLGSLAMLRDEEVPRRIAFVSDKVFEPSWWQRLNPRLNPMFASACLIAAAIVAHGFMTPPGVDASTQALIQQKVDQVVAKEIDDRMLIFEQQDKNFRQALRASMDLVTY